MLYMPRSAYGDTSSGEPREWVGFMLAYTALDGTTIRKRITEATAII